MFRTRGVRAVVAGSLLAIVTASPATAGQGVDIDASADSLHFTRLLPGDRESGVFTVANDSDGDVVISLSAEVTGAAENGCQEPEDDVGDVTCGATGGELARWLTVHVRHGDEFLWSGPIDELEEAVVLSDDLPAGDTWDLALAVEVPLEATNEIMTDQLWFDLNVTAVAGEQATGGGGGTQSVTHVLGVEATGETPDAGPGVPSVVAAGLDLPGVRELREIEADRLLLLGFGVLGVLVAAAMVVSARRRQDRG